MYNYINDYDIVLVETNTKAKRSKHVKRKINLWKKVNVSALKDAAKIFQNDFKNDLMY